MRHHGVGYLLLSLIIMLNITTIGAATQPAPLPTPPAPPSWLTLDVLNRIPLSGDIYLSTRATILKLAQTSAQGATAPQEASAATGLLLGLQPTPDSYGSDTRLTYDSIKDAEPAVITRQLSGVNYTIVAAQKRPTATNFNIYVHTRDSNGGTYDPQLSLPQGSPWSGSGYIDNGDSLFARAASSASYQWVNRIYCVGTVNTGTAFVVPSGIALWYSDNGGVTWSANPSKVVENMTSNVYLDKPAIAASQSYGTGYVYVTYVRLNGSGGQNEIHVARSGDGGVTFTQDVCVEKDGNGNCTEHWEGAPQILVDDQGGLVYALWIDIGFNQIKRAYSTDQGLTWSTPAVIADGNSGPQFGGHFIQAAQLVHNTTAPTTLMAKFNTVSRTINIVWHAWNAGYTDTDAFFATKSAGMSSWLVKLVDGANTTNDQFFPALDFDGSGYVLVSYYSRAEDGNNHAYRQKSVIVKSTDGTNVRGEEPAFNDFNGSLPAELQYLTDATANPEGTGGWVGDYHDVYYSQEYGKFLSAWIAWPSATSQHFELFDYGLWY